jgi:uncharacterized protein (DUF2141 family)
MTLIIMLLSLLMTIHSPQQNNELTLTVTNIPNQEGVIRVLLFKGKDGFPDDQNKAFKSAIGNIDGNKSVIVFKDLPPGKYALSLFHDSQNSGKIRTNAFGIPRDGYGFSNNVMGSFGPPDFEKAAFDVSGPKNNVSIKLR